MAGRKVTDDFPTRNQIAKMEIESRRLGLPAIDKHWCRDHGQEDFCWSDAMKIRHSQRLLLFSQIIGREIASRSELTSGDAGKIIGILCKCESVQELMEILPKPRASVTLAERFALIMASLFPAREAR